MVGTVRSDVDGPDGAVSEDDVMGADVLDGSSRDVVAPAELPTDGVWPLRLGAVWFVCAVLRDRVRADGLPAVAAEHAVMVAAAAMVAAVR